MKFMETIKKTGRIVEDTFSPSMAKTGTQDILDTLKHEHDEVKELLEQLVESQSAPTRKSLLKKIKLALIPHVRAEEKIVYDAVIAQKDKNEKIDGEEGYIEHDLADKTIAKLDKIANAASPEFSAAAKVLKELITHHVEEEERNVWKDVRKHFDGDKRIEMNKKYEAMKKKVRVA